MMSGKVEGLFYESYLRKLPGEAKQKRREHEKRMG